MPKQVSSSYKWAFTACNYTKDTQIHLVSVCANEGLCIVSCPEIAPSTGTPHLQGAICSMVQRKDKKGVLRYPAWRPTVFGKHISGSGSYAINGKKADPMLVVVGDEDASCTIAFTRMEASPQSNYEYCIKTVKDNGMVNEFVDTFPLKFRPKPEWLLGDKAPGVINAKKWGLFLVDCRMIYDLLRGRQHMMRGITRIQGKGNWPTNDDLFTLKDTAYYRNLTYSRDKEYRDWDSFTDGPNPRCEVGWADNQLYLHYRKYKLRDGEAEKVAYRFEEKYNISPNEIIGSLNRWAFKGSLDKHLEVYKERVCTS